MPQTRMRKTWTQKLAEAKAKEDLPKIVQGCTGRGEIVVPSIDEVEQAMAAVPLGQTITVSQIAENLADQHGVGQCCSMTTGIFAWIVANAHHEAGDAAFPWWRTTKAKGELNPKNPDGPTLQAERLRAEGHQIADRKGKLFLA